MKEFPANRACPLSGDSHARVLAYLSGAAICAANSTYRKNFSEILGISPTDKFPIVESPSGFVFAGWMPPDDFLSRVYEDVIDHSKTITETIGYRQALLGFGAAFLRVATLILGSASKPLRLLDYGCGYGTLTRMLAARDIRSYGYDPSAARRAIATHENLEIFDDLDKVAAEGPFNLFVCTEVLEHALEPRKILKFIKRTAAPGALLAITVPQCESVFMAESFASFSRGGELPQVINPWEHLNYFSAESLRELLAEEGFKVVSDYGQGKQLLDACLRVGDAITMKARIRSSLGIAKALVIPSQSTELICQVA